MRALSSTTSRLPKHQRIANLLRQQVRTNRYRPGRVLPPIRDLAEQMGVSPNAVYRALRVLRHEGVVETMPGQGVRVLTSSDPEATPLTFGFVEPFGPDAPFYGDIQAFLAAAMEQRNDHVIPRSSSNDPVQERSIIDRLVDTGVQGLIVWPAPGMQNSAYFRRLAKMLPIVFVDRVIEGVQAPCVSLDWERLGRRIIAEFRRVGIRHALILEDPTPISSYGDLYRGMHHAAKLERGFYFPQVCTTDFSTFYGQSPQQAVEQQTEILQHILAATPYEAIFSPQDAYLDAVYASTFLAAEYPIGNVVTITHPRPALRSLDFYRLCPVRWVNPLDRVLAKAIDLLDEAVHLHTRRWRPLHLDFERTQSSSQAALAYEV